MEQEEQKKEPVGFAKYPEHINRNGRPRKGQAVTDLMREHLWYKTDEEQRVPNAIKFINTVWDMAIQEKDLAAIKLIWNYLDGMPTQYIQAQISDGLEDISDDELNNAIREATTEN
jgi:hypothetical protein